jgi:hypothetical protein
MNFSPRFSTLLIPSKFRSMVGKHGLDGGSSRSIRFTLASTSSTSNSMLGWMFPRQRQNEQDRKYGINKREFMVFFLIQELLDLKNNDEPHR